MLRPLPPLLAHPSFCRVDNGDRDRVAQDDATGGDRGNRGGDCGNRGNRGGDCGNRGNRGGGRGNRGGGRGDGDGDGDGGGRGGGDGEGRGGRGGAFITISVMACTAALVIACGGSSASDVSSAPPADFAGRYSVSVTNSNNGCDYANWRLGESAQNLTFDIAQSGSEASGNLVGLGSFTFALLGIGTLKGTISGSTASITAVGTTSIKKGQCAYFIRATADLTLTGNTVNGTMTYRNETNKSPDCGTLETCTSQQSVAGNRPPK